VISSVFVVSESISTLLVQSVVQYSRCVCIGRVSATNAIAPDACFCLQHPSSYPRLKPSRTAVLTSEDKGFLELLIRIEDDEDKEPIVAFLSACLVVLNLSCIWLPFVERRWMCLRAFCHSLCNEDRLTMYGLARALPLGSLIIFFSRRPNLIEHIDAGCHSYPSTNYGHVTSFTEFALVLLFHANAVRSLLHVCSGNRMSEALLRLWRSNPRRSVTPHALHARGARLGRA
jgi:hypothetical protein